MKKINLIIIALVGLTFFACKQNPANKINPENLQNAQNRDSKFLGLPEIGFDKQNFDFGTINEGDLVNGDFKIYNKGKSDLIISHAQASCGCTIPKWPKDPIKPGDSATLSFSFNSHGKVGKQNKSITLQTNTEKGVEILYLKGTVTPKK